MSTMRPIRPMRTIAAAVLLASLALTGCRTSQADQAATPGNQPPATTPAPATKAPASTTPTTTAPSSEPSPTKPPVTGDRVCVGAQSWGTGPKRVSAAPITAEISNVRAAAHQGCDRVVFDLNGLGRVGYLVGYVPTVHADPSDQPIRVTGGAALQVTIQAPDFRESGHQPWRTPWQLGQRLFGPQTMLREVRFAGSFEHVTTFAVGVRSQRPFRVLVLPDPGNHATRVVVDIAH
jgi:hypothetical protein